jgi:hypothetical protein
MKKETDPKYIVWIDGETIVGTDLADLKVNLQDCCGDDVQNDDSWDLPLYKLIGTIRLEKPPTTLKITLPKGA